MRGRLTCEHCNNLIESVSILETFQSSHDFDEDDDMQINIGPVDTGCGSYGLEFECEKCGSDITQLINDNFRITFS